MSFIDTNHRIIVLKQLENPEEKDSIYYSGVRKLPMDHLPKGKDYQEMRNIIYDEKNIFLNLGKRKSDGDGFRGSGGHMTFSTSYKRHFGCRDRTGWRFAKSFRPTQ